MSELLGFSVAFAMFSGYVVAFSGLVFGLTLLADRCWEVAARKREFWVLAAVCCLLPAVMLAVPVQPLAMQVIELIDLADAGDIVAQVQVAPRAISVWPDISEWMCLMWLVVFTLVAAMRVASSIRQRLALKKMIATAVAATKSQKLPATCRRYLLRIQRQRAIDIRITEQSCSPFVVGLLKPTLVISMAAANALSLRQFQLMVRHELAHVARADVLIAECAQVLRCGLWFSPFLMRILDQLYWATEASCDSTVLAQRPQLATTYGQAMINILRVTQPGEQQLATAFIYHTRRTTKMRMQWILNSTHKNCFTWTQRIATTCGVVALSTGAFLLQPGFAWAVSSTASQFENPVPQARVSSSFGQKKDRFHEGVDLAIGKGATVVAAGDGQVIVSTDVLGNKVNYGKIIIIEHANGLLSLYSHLDARSVEKGDKVVAGEKIGEVGETGKATGPHLHFEILKDKKRLDPSLYIEFPENKKYSQLILPPVM